MRTHKAWDASPRYESFEKIEPAIAGESDESKKLSPVSRAANILLAEPWGSRPRPYAYAYFAG
jgi:hypothetical protein